MIVLYLNDYRPSIQALEGDGIVAFGDDDSDDERKDFTLLQP